MDRPTTAADCLDSSAAMIGQMHEGIVLLGEVCEMVDIPGPPEVEQTDLRMIAQWLREHPEVDEQIMGLLSLDELS